VPTTRLRGLLTRQFTHRRVQALELAIARLTDSLLGTLAVGGAGGRLTAERRASPRDDLVSELVAAADSPGARISQLELVENLILLLVAGFETTTNLLGNGLQIILSDPAAGIELRAGSVPPAAFVEEVLRYDAPVQQTGRRRRTGLTFRGFERLPVSLG